MLRSSWSTVPVALIIAAMSALPACGSSEGSPPSAELDDGPDASTPISDGGTPTPTPDHDASSPPPPAPPPLGPVGEWTWFDVPGATCGLGQDTGFAVNVGTGSDILIYLEGGGLCWDEISCHVDIPNFVPLASYFMAGYTEQTFRGNTPRSGIFDRARADNPFKNSTIVYVPYCTGDFHAGTTTQGFPVSGLTAHYSGRQNLDLYLAKLTAAYPQPSRVTLAGTSAGGFGALINFGHVHDVFGKTRVDLISDSAPALWMQAPIWSGLGSWNVGAALPAGCRDCGRDLRGLYAYYSNTYPDSRLAVTTFDADFAMGTGGYALLTPWQFTDALRRLSDSTLAPLANFHAFIPSGSAHGMLYNLDTVTQPRDCVWFLGMCVSTKNVGEPSTLGQWLTRMETDDPTWATAMGIAR